MKINYKIDQESIKDTKAMLRSEMKSRPISMSQIFYAEVRVESEKNGGFMEMGRVPLFFFLIDLINFLVLSSGKKMYQQTISDENQDYTVYLRKDDRNLLASFVKNGGIKSVEFDLPNADEISRFAKNFIEEYIRLVPEIEYYSNLRYVYEELNVS